MSRHRGASHRQKVWYTWRALSGEFGSGVKHYIGFRLIVNFLDEVVTR